MRTVAKANENSHEMKLSDELFRLMVNSVKDYAIFMLDTNGNVASWNEGAKRFKGYEAGEIIGKHFSTFYTRPDIERNHPENELKLATRDGRYEEEGWRVRKDGSTFWANVVITRLDDQKGKHIGFVKVTRDLTERKNADENLRMAYQNLERRVQERTVDLENALKSRDEFLSIASHELKTPLTSLRLQLQLSNKKIERNHTDAPIFKELSRSLDIGVRQVTSLTHLVNDLLDISRIQTGNFALTSSSLNLSELVDEIAQRFKEQIEQSRNTIELHLDPDITGSWDKFRLEQVLINLISNAIKYAPRSKIEIKTHKKDDRAVLEVCDHGPGIEPAKVEKIFNRFERGNHDSTISGLGLGLFITKKIVEHHRGNISVDSPPGKGARFIIELPL